MHNSRLIPTFPKIQSSQPSAVGDLRVFVAERACKTAGCDWYDYRSRFGWSAASANIPTGYTVIGEFVLPADLCDKLLLSTDGSVPEEFGHIQMLGLRTQIEGPIGSLGMLTFYPLGRYVEILTKRNVAAKIEYFAFRSLRNHYGPYQRRHSETTMEPERRDQLIGHGRDPEGNETVWEGESKILAKIREREPDYRPIFYPNIQSIPQNFSAAPPED